MFSWNYILQTWARAASRLMLLGLQEHTELQCLQHINVNMWNCQCQYPHTLYTDSQLNTTNDTAPVLTALVRWTIFVSGNDKTLAHAFVNCWLDYCNSMLTGVSNQNYWTACSYTECWCLAHHRKRRAEWTTMPTSYPANDHLKYICDTIVHECCTA